MKTKITDEDFAIIYGIWKNDDSPDHKIKKKVKKSNNKPKSKIVIKSNKYGKLIMSTKYSKTKCWLK